MAEQRKLILTICTGNICRSPMAEKLLQHALEAEEAPLNQLVAVSAGVASGFGDPASANSVAAMKKVKLDLGHHKSQPVSTTLIDEAFAIFGMTHSHIESLRHSYAQLPKRVHLFREFMGSDHDLEIPDPFGQNYEAYAESMNSMVEAIPSIIRYLKAEYRP